MRFCTNQAMEHLGAIVNSNNNSYYVSTTDTFDEGFETMVFRCKKYYPNISEANRNIEDVADFRTGGEIDWSGLYCETFKTAKEARKRHKYICTNITEFIQTDILLKGENR